MTTTTAPTHVVLGAGPVGTAIAGEARRPVHETIEMLYEFEQPFVLDSKKIERAFEQTPTPLEVSIPATVAWWKRHQAEVAARPQISSTACA